MDAQPLLVFPPFMLDVNERILWRQTSTGKQRIPLRPLVLRLLQYFAEHAGEMLSRPLLQEALWGSAVKTMNVDQQLNSYISQLRNALKETMHDGCFIETIPRHGYRFLATVTPLASIRLGYVPPEPPLVLGRHDDVVKLQQRLGIADTLQPSPAVTILRGLPGVGKTTLAALLAHDPFVAGAFPDGVLWVSLGQKPQLFSVLQKWGAFVGVPPDAMQHVSLLQEAVHLVAEQIRPLQMLLIVDDVWTLEDAAPFLALRGAACRLLLTTRVTEVARSLTPTPDATVYHLRELGEEAALALLHAAVPTVVADHPRECRLLVQSLECLPLALRVAGHLLNAEAHYGWGVTHLLADLQRGARIIGAKAPADLFDYERDAIPTVAALLKKSTDVLEPHIRECFAYLGVYAPEPATFDLAAMQSSWQVDDPRPIARVLVDQGLLEPVDDRFQMHALFVSLAKSLLEG